MKRTRHSGRTSPAQATLKAWRKTHRREDVETSGLRPLVNKLNTKQRLFFELVSRMSVRDVEEVTRAYHDFNPAVDVIYKSTADENFIKVGEILEKELNSRSLRGVNVVAIILDGTEVGKHTMVWAMGVTIDGTKVPLGVEQGETETAVVVARLLHNLQKRGLDITDVLMVTDGGKAIMAALKGNVVQRCVVHKARDVIERNLKVAERVAIGRRLVADHREALARGGEAAAERRLRKIDRELLEKLEKAEDDRRRTAEDKTQESPAEEQCLREIGEDGVRRGLYRAWARDKHSEAVAGLKAEAAWLDHGGHKGAAKSVREGIEGTTTLQRIGIKDRQLRELMRTSNLIESAHGFVKELKGRGTFWRDIAMRLRFFAVAIAKAELSWRLVTDRSRLEDLPLAVARARYPEINLEIQRNDARPNTLELERVAVKSGSAAKVEPALANLLRSADRIGKTIVVSERVLASLPPAPERQQWLAERGFAPRSEHDGALVRAPRSDGGRREGDTDAGGRASTALSELHKAIDEDRRPLQARREVPRLREPMGDDLRLLSGIAETSMRMVPTMLELKDDQLKLEAAGLTAARHDLTTLKSDVDAWWEANWQDAAKEAAAQWGHAKRDGGPLVRPFDGGRAWVLDQRQVDRMRGRARGHVAELEAGDWSKLPELQRSAGALAGLDALVHRFDRAARAVAAAQVLDLHAQIDRVRAAAGMAGAVIEPGTYDPRALSPIDQHAGALGQRRTELLSDVGKAIAPLLQKQKLDDAALLKLRDEIGNPWRKDNLNKAQAYRGALEEGKRDGVMHDYYRAVRQKADLAERARGSGVGDVVREALSKAAKAEDIHDHFLGRLGDVEQGAAAFREQDGSAARFMIEHGAAAALHNAVEMQRRERSLPPPALEVGQARVDVSADVDIGTGAGVGR